MKSIIKAMYLFSLLIGLISCTYTPRIDDVSSLFEEMKNRHDGLWFQSFRFKQLTISYNEEGVKTDSTVWFESVTYPNLFRIDRDTSTNTYTIFRNDSTYSFRNDSLINAIDKPATHLLYKGGLYFMSLNEALQKLEKYNYDTSVFRRDTFMKQEVYVVGGDHNNFWINAKDYYCKRRIYTTNSNKKVDVIYDHFTKLENGWVEQKVTFYVDGIKRLEEFYFDIKKDENINDDIYSLQSNYMWYRRY